MPITGLNLALSNRCSGRCVFCPAERGRKDPGGMPPALVERMVEEVTGSTWPWRVKSVQLGENGDALMNPDFLSIARLLRKRMPGARINLTTNLFNMTPDIAQAILRERLLNGLQLNVDGHDAETYEAQKRLPYARVMEALRDFLEARERRWPDFPMSINVLTLTDYCAVIERRYGRMPLAAPAVVPPSSFEQVRESLSWLPESVAVHRLSAFAWAERRMEGEFNGANSQCPQLSRVETEAFVSPSGLWYPCCLDSNQDQAFGNVYERGLLGLYNSPERANFLRKLRDRKFQAIGYPCDRVDFCRGSAA